MRKLFIAVLISVALINGCSRKTGAGNSGSSSKLPARKGEVLFLGNASKHHDATKYSPWLAESLSQLGINTTYTIKPADLNDSNLSKYDGLIIYANHNNISPAQEAALKNFVEGGKGFIPLHAASACFGNSEWYIKTVGGQYKSERTGVFTPKIINTSHPVMQGVQEFTTWDERYVHQKINPDMTVLMERVEGETREPWTWVRTQGKGRVFYTASGHNDSTWTNPAFMRLVNNGVLWAIGDQVKDQIRRFNRSK
jgi:type 1 glutamine amidotransferase